MLWLLLSQKFFLSIFIMNNLSNLTQLIHEMLYEFIGEMSPDYEMCVDFLESQDIEVSDEVSDIILELLYPEEED